MTELFQQLLDWIALHPLWAGICIFLVSMAESLAIVGLIVPGVMIMFGIGALIATGVIPFWSAMAWAVAGAVTGDGLSFLVGYHFRDRLADNWPFNRHSASLEKGIAFFASYGGKSVAIGRFFGPVRAIIPLVAGMMSMQPWRFAIANVLSALVWAPVYLIPGILFGASLELASQVAFRLVILILLLALLTWLVIWLVRRVFRFVHPHASIWLQALLNWSRLHPAFTDIAEALADRNHPESRVLAILATLLIITTGLFTAVCSAVIEGTAIAGWNQTVLQALQSLHTPWGNEIMVHISRLADIRVIIALILGVLAFLAWHRHWRTVLYWLAAAGFGLLASVALKYSLQIPRPAIGISGLTPYAFPSSHVMRATVLFSFLAVMIARALRADWRWLPYSLAGVLIMLVALSRLYLGIHWLSDILGSLSLGLIWISLLGIAYHRHTVIETHWRGLSATVLVVLLSTYGAFSWIGHPQDMVRYTPVIEAGEITTTAWKKQAWTRLPQYQQDTSNLRNYPLNIQYAGPLKSLRDHLTGKDWRPAPMLNWGNVLRLLSPSMELTDLPVFPQIHNGHQESLVLIKELPQGRRIVLRLWRANLKLQPEGQPLWVGSVTEQQQAHMGNLLTFTRTKVDLLEPWRQLLEDTQGLPQHQPEVKPQQLLLWSR